MIYRITNYLKRIFPSARDAAIFNIDNRIALECPSAQAALDIFKGTWVSRLPGDFKTGTTPLFDDTRIPAATPFLGSVEGLDVLDLGPLEGGQAYVLQQMGARSVVSVESNTILYLKCLVAKEVLAMDRVRFLCGDAVQYLKQTDTRFDMCVASGILYHMDDPVELLWLLSQRTEKLLIWTHYFDERETARNKIQNFKTKTHAFRGVSYNYHQQQYGVGFFSNILLRGYRASQQLDDKGRNPDRTTRIWLWRYQHHQ